MKHQEYLWKSHDGLDIYAQSWQPEASQPLAVINLVHGLGEHSGRYAEWAEWFVAEGYAFLSLDYRGHGKSGGKRGHTDEYLSYMRDIGLLLSKSEELFPNIPVILYGHSLGGNLVINYAIRFRPAIFALIATSPWLKLAFEPPRLKIWAGKILKSLFPAMLNSNGLVASQLSRDPEVGIQYARDPLVHDKISLTTFFAVMTAGNEAIKNAYRINVPFLLMHGSGDMITSHAASQDLVKNSNDNTTFRLWNDACHELHHEPNKQEVFRYALKWLDELIKEKKEMNGYF